MLTALPPTPMPISFASRLPHPEDPEGQQAPKQAPAPAHPLARRPGLQPLHYELAALLHRAGARAHPPSWAHDFEASWRAEQQAAEEQQQRQQAQRRVRRRSTKGSINPNSDAA